jgi:DNA-binding CsgD family transcriptional regulator
MPRHRSLEIVESAEFLGRLERKHRTGPFAARTRMLRVLRRRPHLSVAAIAELIGVSAPTIDRWIGIYRRGGVEALLSREPRQRRSDSKLPLRILEAMARRYRSGALGSIEEVRLWLAEYHGIDYSRSSVGVLLKGFLDADRERETKSPERNWSRSTTIRLGESEHGFEAPPGDTTADAALLLRLLNNAPKSFDSASDIAALRDALAVFVPTVDRMMIAVDTAFDPLAPEAYVPTAEVIQHSARGRSRGVSVRTEAGSRTFSQSILEGLYEQGFPHGEYHPATVIDLTYRGSTAIACILLWRERTKSALLDRDLASIERLRPFLESTVVTIIVRHQHRRPQEGVIDKALVAATKRYQLTPQERRIMTYRMLGHSYKQIASVLEVTQDNVKKHLQSVHRKTGTVSIVDMFGKLFMPRLTR